LLSFLGIEDAIAVFVELLGDHIILAADVAIAIEVITDVGSALGVPLLRKFGTGLFLLLGHPRARPPLRNVHVLSQDVAPVVARLLLDLKVPTEDINPGHLMLGRVELHAQT